MRKQLLISTVIVLSVFVSCFAEPGDLIWSWYEGMNGRNDSINDIAWSDVDNALYLYSTGAPAIITKLSVDGSVIWSRQYLEFETDCVPGIIALNEGGFIFASCEVMEPYINIACADSSGELLWTRSEDVGTFYISYDADIVRCPEGFAILISPSSYNPIKLLKFSESGQLEWSWEWPQEWMSWSLSVDWHPSEHAFFVAALTRGLGGNDLNQYFRISEVGEHVWDVAETVPIRGFKVSQLRISPTGEIYYVGTQGDDLWGTTAYVGNISVDGENNSRTAIPDLSDPYVHDIHFTQDGHFLIFGSAGGMFGSGGFIMQMLDIGLVDWVEYYYISSYVRFGSGEVLPSGNIIGAGAHSTIDETNSYVVCVERGEEYAEFPTLELFSDSNLQIPAEGGEIYYSSFFASREHYAFHGLARSEMVFPDQTTHLTLWQEPILIRSGQTVEFLDRVFTLSAAAPDGEYLLIVSASTSEDSVLVADTLIVEKEAFTDVSESSDLALPDNSEILSIYPNPFNLSTTFSLSLESPTTVYLNVYDLLGQKVATVINGETLNSGVNEVAFKATDLASGRYFVSLKLVDGRTATKMFTLVK